MTDSTICDGCGKELSDGATICAHCGWDLSASLARPARPSAMSQLKAGGWRLIAYGLILVLPLVGFMRLRTTGPGPDLVTTIRWMIFGDGGRSAELETIHRMHEIGSASSRYSIREEEMPPFDGDWAEVLAPSATARIRGWIPLVFFGADTTMAPASVREMYEIRPTDGWGRPFRVNFQPLINGEAAFATSQVIADFENGLNSTFFNLGTPELERGKWIRLEISSAGRDRVWDTDDDLLMVSYVQIGHVYRLLYDPTEVQKRIERGYTIGRHYFRIEGSEYDLIDARLLAEFRLTSLH